MKANFPTTSVKHYSSYKRMSTLLAALVVVGALASAFMIASSSAALKTNRNWGRSSIASMRPFGCTAVAVVYVNASWVGVTPGTDPDGAGPATDFGCASFATIQGGVDGVATGGTVNVLAGTYPENVLVNKSVSLLGPNAAINPNTGSRVAEAFVLPAVTETSVQGSTSGTIFRLGNGAGHSDVTIKGFTLDGHNASLAGGRTLNGVEISTGAGIDNSIGSFDTNPGGYDVRMIVQNNIIQNLERYGVLADGVPATPLAGTDVSFNKIDNLPSGNNFGGGRGRGVAFEENHYGSVTNNVITRVNVGWQDDDYNLASPGSGTLIDQNEIHTYHRGIFHNLQFQNATNATITNNNIFVETTGDFPASTTNFGIELASIQNAVGATVTGNSSTGNVYGILLWDLPTTANIVVTGGTLSGNVYGVFATSIDPQFGATIASHSAISGVTITGATTAGVGIEDNPATAATALEITGNTSVSGSPKGISVVGAGASANIHDNAASIHNNTVGIDVDGGSGTITGNTLFANGTGLRFSNGASGTAHFNRFISTTTAIDNPNSLTLNLENNWWGCNAGPGNAGCGAVTGTGADFNPWMVLGVSATPATIPQSGNSTTTADMTHNSDGAVPVGTLPDMPVAWSATNGTMAPPTGTITAGQAMSTFTSTSASSGTSCATVDGQLSCANITVLPTTVTITPAAAPTAADNDYTRINNAIQATFAGQTIKLAGTFDWTEANAAASWAMGSNGIAGDLDDFSILVPANINNVTFTADNLGDATIQGPGDVPTVDLEGVFFFNDTVNQNWTISNIRFLDFDLAIGMFSMVGATNYNNTHITNNYVRMARDVATPTDVAQNIAIYYSFGTNQVISGNTIDIQGDAVTVGGNNAADIGMQCDSSGGAFYDGLQITNNTIHVLNAQSATPEVIIGIWENGHSHGSNITISGNTFTNQGAGNNPATNLQRGFRVTSHSSLTSAVTYQNNTVTGANIGFQWIAGPTFAGNQPVNLKSNTITGNGTGVLVQSQGLANLSFNRIVGNTTGLNNVDGTVTAENNWWGCNAGPGNAGCDAVTGVADSNPWLVLGVSAAPNPIVPLGTSTITADLTRNSDAAITSGSGTLPITPVAFSATNGTIAPPTGNTTAGQANSTFTSTSASSGTACAMVDNQQICTSISVASPVTVSLPHVTGPTGTNISVPITVGDLTGKAVRSYDLQVTFDPTVVQPLATPFDSAGTLSSGMLITPNATNVGHLIISAFQATDLSGAGTLLNLRFMIVGAPGASTPLTFADYTDPGTTFHPGFRFNAGAPAATTSNGSIHVNGPTAASGTVNGRVTDDQGRPLSGTVVRLSGSQARKTITDVNGEYHFDEVAVADFYTVTPTRANYAFNPGQRSFSVLGSRTEASFAALFNGESANPLDTSEYFVRQQYVDILGREPDETGFNYWSDQINACNGETRCLATRRIDVAAAFFIEQEFQSSGLYLYNVYSGALGRRPAFTEFAADRLRVVGGANLDAEKIAFAAGFVERAEFLQKYATNTTAASFVDALLSTVEQSARVDLSGQRDNLISRYNAGASQSESRSLVLRGLADNAAFKAAQYNAAFVSTEYFSYLQRDAEPEGFAFWLNVLDNRTPGNYRGMVCSFTTAAEYQRRFSTIVTHSNSECGQ